MTALLVAIGYLCGSIPFGVLVAKLRGIDLRAVGSGNIGATNAARALGRPLGVLVLVCDAAKALVPIAVMRAHLPTSHHSSWILAGVGFAAVLGHLFPIWLKLHGGKGVASSLGVFLALEPKSVVIAAVVWIVLYALFRISSLASLFSSAALLLLLGLVHAPVPDIVLACMLFPIIVLRHRQNLVRLVHGDERKNSR